MNLYDDFKKQCSKQIEIQSNNDKLKKLSSEWFNLSHEMKYSYHFEWMGRPIIQYPQHIIAIQEIIWEIKPNLIIETGIAHDG